MILVTVHLIYISIHNTNISQNEYRRAIAKVYLKKYTAPIVLGRILSPASNSKKTSVAPEEFIRLRPVLILVS